VKIGVISDTHGFLDGKVFDLFAGVEHILHAGDIGYSSIILELETIAPVTAVNGNTDLGLPFRESEAVELDGRKFLVHHIVNPFAWSDRLKPRMARDKPEVVVFGHTHKRFNEIVSGVLFLNPGYSGKPKLETDRSVAVLHCDKKGIRVEYLEL
jgi:putative phosphoesterase